ncbi:MAG: tetratricopeptide repeat protein [Archangiaceae bacterium]|nr:tetratricopeptide repeat protein [Archangiaceae bacterium]
MAQDRDRLEKQVAELNAQVDRLKGESQVAAAAEQRAAEVYKQMTTLAGDDRLRAIDALAKLDTSKVSVFAQRALQDRSALLRKEVGSGMFERGMKSYHRNEFGPAAEELTRFLALGPPEDDANDATYALGYALFQLKKYDQALPVLQKYVGGPKNLKNRDYAMVMTVQLYDVLKQPDKALELSKDALQAYPDSQFAGLFRRRIRAAAEAEKTAAPGTGAPAPAEAKPEPKPITPTSVSPAKP